MRSAFEDSPARPLLTPGAIAGIIAGVLAFALGAYLVAFGGMSSFARALGFGPAPSTAGGTSTTPPPLQLCGQDLGQLKLATLEAFRVMGEFPSPEAIASTEGLPTSDPWGNPYRYHLSLDRRQAWFSSDGPDGIAGNTDDIETAKIP